MRRVRHIGLKLILVVGATAILIISVLLSPVLHSADASHGQSDAAQTSSRRSEAFGPHQSDTLNDRERTCIGRQHNQPASRQ